METKNKREILFKERCSFGFSVVVGNLGIVLLAAFISYYYTDVVGLSAAVATGIASICTVFDGISDIFMGVVIDKTKSRWGKVRPWILFGGIGDGILLILTFAIPDFSSMEARIVYAFLTYFLLKVVFGTMAGVSANTLITVITDKERERNSLGTYNVIFNVIFSMIASAVTLPLATALGNTKSVWSGIIAVYGVLIIILSIIGFLGTKERVTMGVKEKNSYPVKILLKALVKNKYFWLLLIALSIYQMFTATGTINVYYYTRVLNNPGAYSISNIGQLVFLLFIPVYLKIVNKMGVRKALMVSCALSGIVLVLRVIVPTSVPVYLVLSILGSICLGPFSVCYMSLTAEIADWGEWKTGIPTQAMTCSLISVAGKWAVALGTALVGYILTATGYDGTQAIQPQSAMTGLIILGTLGGGIGYLMMSVCIKFIRVDKDSEVMHRELAERRGLVQKDSIL